MKKYVPFSFRILFLLLLLLLACGRGDGKNKEAAGSLETQETIIEAEKGEAQVAEDFEDAASSEDMSTLITGLSGLFGGSGDSTQQGLFKDNGALNLEYLRSDEGAAARKAFGSIVGISEEEVEIALTALPDNNIVSVKHAEKIEQSLVNPEIQSYIDSGNASENFKSLLEENKEEAKARTTDFKAKAKAAKDAFYKLNPSWFSVGENLEDTYIDSRKEMVYLPLGELSFADSVIVFNPGNPGGFKPEAITGPAQGYDPYTVEYCNLGIEGSIVVFFKDNAITDVNGPDIYVFELGEIEPTRLAISKDGIDWIDVGQIEGGTAGLDISKFIESGESFNYLKLKDLNTQSGVPGADIDAIAAIGGAVRLSLDSEVLFDTGEYELKPEGIEAIKNLAQQMENLDRGVITVEGHTDDIGSSQSNLELSQKRAASVAAMLKNNVGNANFKWKEVGYGENQPIVPNDSDENRSINRRVEILVSPR